MTHFGRLFKSVSIYGVGNILLRLVGFITIPVFTRIFSPSDYGIIESIGSFVAVLSVFALLSLDSASQRSFFDYSSEQGTERTTVLSTAFWTLLAWSAILSLCGVLASRMLAGLLFQDASYSGLLVIAFLGMPVTLLVSYLQGVLNLWQQPTRYVFTSVIYSILTVAGSIYFAAGIHWGLFGYYFGVVLGGVIALIVIGGLVWSGFRFVFSMSELRVMLAYSLPLIPTAAFSWIVQSADRFFLLRYATTADVGWYSLGVRMANILLLVTSAFGTAWGPFVLDLYNRAPEEEPAIRARTLNYLAMGLAFCALGLSIFAREALLIISTPEFNIAYQVVGMLAGGVVLNGMMVIVMTGISLSRKTKYFFLGTLVSAVVNTILNFLLIPPFGMYGAALATLLSFASLLVFYLVVAQRLSPAPYKYQKLVVILAPAVILTVIGTFTNFESILLSLMVKSLLILAYPVLIWLFGGFTREEMNTLGKWVIVQIYRFRGGQAG